jgi:sialate O-acetylesterase
LPPQKAGGPYTLSITAGAQSLTVNDLLVGDVFVCSGQSNMEFVVRQSRNGASEIARSADPLLRLMKIAIDPRPAPLAQFDRKPEWRAASPASVSDFSAACFFMGQSLRRGSRVPVGLITAAVGGSAIQTWMSGRAYRAQGGNQERADLLALLDDDPDAANARWGRIWEDWWRSSVGVLQGLPWQDDPADAEWLAEPKGGFWSSWDVPQLKTYQGMIWFRREIILTADQAAKGAVLDLGPARLLNQTWVNGAPVGNFFGWDIAPRYTLPIHSLKAGRNVIVAALSSFWGPGGFLKPEVRSLQFADGTRVPLADQWTYRAMPVAVGEPPRSPWDMTAGINILYNGMIAPIGPYPVKAIAWYQGEAHTSAPTGYAGLLRGMMADWRGQFGARTPFLIVQIASFGGSQTASDYSGSARLRDEQRRAVIADGNSRLIVTTDIGEADNIHPLNKQDVGKRLALALREIERPGSLPPLAAPVVSRLGGTLKIQFRSGTGLKSTASAVGPFILCGPASANCHAVAAVLAGDAVTIDTGNFPAAAARYCWADSPTCSLRDRADLPVSPFEVALPPAEPGPPPQLTPSNGAAK